MKIAKIELADYEVCARSDLEELSAQGIARIWAPGSSRHRIFHQMKYLGLETWHGNWGPELIVHDPFTGFCSVWSTEPRSDQIRTWIRESVWNP